MKEDKTINEENVKEVNGGVVLKQDAPVSYCEKCGSEGEAMTQMINGRRIIVYFCNKCGHSWKGSAYHSRTN